MLVRPVILDATLTVRETLTRLARHGLWHKPTDRGAQEYLQGHAARIRIPWEELSERLQKSLDHQHVAIRREWRGNVLWYSLPAADILTKCLGAHDDQLLVHALRLSEGDSKQPLELTSVVNNLAPIAEDNRVVIDRGEAVAVSVPTRPDVAHNLPRSPGAEAVRARRSMGGVAISPAPPSAARSDAPERVEAWPRLEAPEYVPALKAFDVVVGLAGTRQAKTAGGPMTLTAPAGTQRIDIDVELTCTGADSADGWLQKLRVPIDDPASVSVTFHLTGREPQGEEHLHLTMLEVRYVMNGVVCGIASRALAIGASNVDKPPAPGSSAPGTPWLSTPPVATSIDVSKDTSVADLTIEMVKADRNARGTYSCWLRSPHRLQTPAGPHDIDLGDEARAFASSVVNLVRSMSGNALITNALDAVSELVAEKLPRAAVSALHEVARATAPNPPTVLLVSADPYVPWELAKIDPPLDHTQPPFLGAQVVMGRWLRTCSPSAVELVSTDASSGVARPPLNPPASIDVRHMAVMVGMYKPASGLQRLMHAELEAASLAKSHDAIPLAASPQALAQLLSANIEHEFHSVSADAVHFAGHGQFQATDADASVLYLNDGKPLSSLLFRSAKYGPPKGNHPLIFLNACMIGIGAELLGDMGGFPGNCLRGGFGGLIGALWEVDDLVAKQIATEFWERALRPNGKTSEAVGDILRELRTRFATASAPIPPATYLAYVYYGHPRLRMQRVS